MLYRAIDICDNVTNSLMLYTVQVGYAVTTYHNENKEGSTQVYQPQKVPVIGFDMGGTSTDVSRFAGEFEHVFEANVAGVSIQAPQVRKGVLYLEYFELNGFCIFLANQYTPMLAFKASGNMISLSMGLYVCLLLLLLQTLF